MSRELAREFERDFLEANPEYSEEDIRVAQKENRYTIELVDGGILDQDPLEVYVALGAKVAMFCGILGIGVALGAAFGLSILQEACIGAGQLPAPGVTVLPGTLEDNACWDGAKQLQSIANGSGILGAGAVLVGGLADRFDDRLLEVVR